MVEIEGVVTDYAWVPKHLDVQKVFLQLQIMLLLHPDHLHCIDFAALQVLTGADQCVTTLSYLLQDAVLLVEAVNPGTFLLLILI